MTESRRRDVFARARSRLAVLFIAIIVALVVVSSLFMYLTVRSALRDAAVPWPPPTATTFI